MVFEESGLVDAHCHIDLFTHPERIVQELDSNLVHTIAVTNAPSVYSHTAALANTSPYLWPAVGLHPGLAVARKRELAQMWRALEETRFVGEIGLDYRTNDPSDRRTQLGVLEEIVARCAEHGDKILTVHSRRAVTDTVSLIGPGYPGRIIMHWYSGTARDLVRAVGYGFYFSVNSAMLSSSKGQGLIAKMPQNRVLTETDGPFVEVNGLPATPSCVSQTLNDLCHIWDVAPGDARSRVMSNFRQLFAGDENS
jgi:TatD DNase family protein